MAYDINHRKHVASYFENHLLATAVELTKDLPRKKRTPSSMNTMSSTLASMSHPKGVVRKVATGVYAWWTKPPLGWQVAAHGDPLAELILRLLTSCPLYNGVTRTGIETVCCRDMGYKLDVVVRKLRQLKRKGFLQGRGQRWALTDKAVGFAFPQTDIPRPTCREREPEPVIDIFS